MAATDRSKKTEVLAEEELEDLALMTAMKEALQSGIATEDEKSEFESWLSQLGIAIHKITFHTSISKPNKIFYPINTSNSSPLH